MMLAQLFVNMNFYSLVIERKKCDGIKNFCCWQMTKKAEYLELQKRKKRSSEKYL